MTGALREGIWANVPEAEYHADPCLTASASSGALRTLLWQSPDHAWAKHPRLNPCFASSESSEAKDAGTVLHAMILETPPPFRVLGFPDFRTVAAKEARDRARAEKLIPLLLHQAEALRDEAAGIRARLQRMPEVWKPMRDAIDSEMSETTLVWRERGVLCRCRYDTLPAARWRASYDLKFTGLSADPDGFGVKVTTKYGMQADFYPRAVQALRGDRPLFVFVAVEREAPHGITLHALGAEAAEIAREQVDAALDLWKRCQRAEAWPSYPAEIHYQDYPHWAKTAWDARQRADEARAKLVIGAGA